MKQIKTISIKCDNEKTLELSEMTELQEEENNCDTEFHIRGVRTE